MDDQLHPILSVRLFTDRKCFGPGVAALLQRVQTHHSLRAAAASMEMAYSKAWTIVRNAEDCLGFKLLHSAAGGKNGGGASLTEEAIRLLAAYDAYCADLRTYASERFVLRFGYLEEDRDDLS